LHQVLTGDDTLALVAVSALASVVGQHRALGLLGLQEQRIEAVVGFYQQDPGFGADAAYADDLAGTRVKANLSTSRCWWAGKVRAYPLNSRRRNPDTASTSRWSASSSSGMISGGR
jgi:hypothetical protein